MCCLLLLGRCRLESHQWLSARQLVGLSDIFVNHYKLDLLSDPQVEFGYTVEWVLDIQKMQ